MLNGVGLSESLVASLAVAVALVAALLVYRDARRHGSYHALSATGAVAISGLVGYAVGGVVGLFVGTGYVLLLYLLSYPTTPTVDPSGPRGDAGENIASEEADDTLSVIRVEVATHETLQELAERYDDVPADGTEAKLRSALRVKALSEVDDTNTGGAADHRPERGLTNPDAPAARASEYSIEEWSNESTPEPTERTGDYDAAAWTVKQPSADERVGDYGAAEWRGQPDDTAEPPSECETDRESEEHTEDEHVSERDDRPTAAQQRSTEDLPDRNDPMAEGAQQWVAENVDRGLGVTVGDALDTPDVYDDQPDETESESSVGDWSGEEPPSESASEHDVADWSADEPPAETETETVTADWSSENPPAESESGYGASEWRTESDDSDGSAGEATAEASAEAETTSNGGVWEIAGEETEQPEEGGMVFDNAVTRAEPASGSDTSAAAATDSESEAESPSDTAEQRSDGQESSGEGDDDPFDGRGELYDGDGTYEEAESRY